MSRGKDEKRILEQARLNRVPPPKWLMDAPVLRPGLELYYYAFWELDTCRSIGMSLGPIPWTAVQAYAKANGYDEDTTDRLLILVRYMDHEYLEYYAKKNKPT